MITGAVAQIISASQTEIKSITGKTWENINIRVNNKYIFYFAKNAYKKGKEAILQTFLCPRNQLVPKTGNKMDKIFYKNICRTPWVPVKTDALDNMQL
jgi:hypothetical protein